LVQSDAELARSEVVGAEEYRIIYRIDDKSRTVTVR
jgi:hypothetical protein